MIGSRSSQERRKNLQLHLVSDFESEKGWQDRIGPASEGSALLAAWLKFQP
jgi:hypothetical protein